MADLIPYTSVREGEMFLTYAPDAEQAREQFASAGLPADARVRKQPLRAADEFRYTFEGETMAATLVGSAPQPAESEPVEPPIEFENSDEG